MAIILKYSPPPDPEKVAKRKSLNNFIFFHTQKWSDHEQVAQLTSCAYEAILPYLKTTGKENILRSLRVVLLNLFEATWIDPSKCVGYSRTKQYAGYKIWRDDKKVAKNRYNLLGIGYTALLDVIDAMVEANLISHDSGYKHPETGKGELSKIRVLDPLSAMFKDFDITISMIGITPKVELIELRDKKTIDKDGNKKRGVLIDYEDTRRNNAKKMRDNLQRINAVLYDNKILLKVTDSEWLELNGRLVPSRADDDGEEGDSDKAPVEYSHKVLKRVFNDRSFKKGGRFYNGWWLRVPKEYRKYITINDQTTIELDYSALHPTLVYRYLAKIDLPEGDPYTLDGHEGNKKLRDLVKSILLRIFNATDREEVFHSIKYGMKKEERIYKKKDLPRGIKALNALFELIEQKHSRIKDKYFYKDKGKDLQFIDSKLAEKVMLTFIERSGGAAILPNHDSFLVTSDREELLRGCMRECSLSILGFEIEVDRKESWQDTESIDHPELYSKYYEIFNQ